ncbi:MAG: EF-P lysine aminoacylase GenX [Methylococcaceae bacterium]|nr:EF-P lysine aminoacylase GenX [Methylococcaceae bacterium]
MAEPWQPACDKRYLRLRAQILADIRRFFADREVLEVETPLLCRATGTDPLLDFFSTTLHSPPRNSTLFLQTSPEFAMKRLLAAGSGSIYQICKAFRNGESGRSHNPEFTILEWYRVGFSLQDLMDEVSELLQGLLSSAFEVLGVRQVSYQRIFGETTGLDPLAFDKQAYRLFAQAAGFPEAVDLCGDEHGLWLDFVFSHCVQPAMAAGTLYLVHDYPAIQSSLARIHPGDDRVAERFEVFANGMELGNGFFELSDVAEQEARFDREIAYRRAHGLAAVEKDDLLLDALRAGLPDCSGIALGLDRLLMIAGKCRGIDEVLAFPLRKA